MEAPRMKETVSYLCYAAHKMGSFGGARKRGCRLPCQSLMGCHPDMEIQLGVILPRGMGSHHLDPDVGGEGLLSFILAGKEGGRWF